MDKEIFELGIPIFAICYGMQLTAQMNGGRVFGESEVSVVRIVCRSFIRIFPE